MGALPPTSIVGIGGSAGGLHAYMSLLDALPSNTGMAFVIVPRMFPSASAQLAGILSRHTKMPVILTSRSMPIRADHVYVSPTDADLRIESGAFNVVSSRTGRDAVIDLFFNSLAEAMGARAIGIILSGCGEDGTEGCRHIKAKEGTVFAQDISAEEHSMPFSARESGCVDFVLSPDKIAAKLRSLAVKSARRHK